MRREVGLEKGRGNKGRVTQGRRVSGESSIVKSEDERCLEEIRWGGGGKMNS
jgi:hypothetical protein